MVNKLRNVHVLMLGLMGPACAVWLAGSALEVNLGTLVLYKAIMQDQHVSAQIPAYFLAPAQSPSVETRLTARRACAMALKWNGTSDGARFCLAFLDVLDGNWAEAGSALGQLRDHDYRPVITNFLLGMSAYRAGRTEQAYAAWRECPNSSCEILFERLRTVESCQIAVAIAPSSSEAYFCLGRTLRDQGRYAEALEAFDQALAFDRPLDVRAIDTPSSETYSRAETSYRIGEIWLTIGESAKAEPYLDQAILLNPAHLWAPLQKSIIEKQLHGRPDRAILLLLALVDRYPNHASAMLHLGWIYEEQGDLTQAGKWFERATQVMPKYALAYVQLARVRARQMEWPTTQKLALRAVELDPSLAEAHYLVGKALCVQGRPAEALTYALRAAEMQPQAPEFMTLVGNIYDRMGNGTEARIWHEHALSLNPDLKSSVRGCGD